MRPRKEERARHHSVRSNKPAPGLPIRGTCDQVQLIDRVAARPRVVTPRIPTPCIVRPCIGTPRILTNAATKGHGVDLGGVRQKTLPLPLWPAPQDHRSIFTGRG